LYPFIWNVLGENGKEIGGAKISKLRLIFELIAKNAPNVGFWGWRVWDKSLLVVSKISRGGAEVEWVERLS